MTFSVSDYFRKLVPLPICVVTAACLMLVFAILHRHSIKSKLIDLLHIIKNWQRLKFDYDNKLFLFKSLIIIFASTVLLTVSCVNLRFGLPLLWEDIDDVQWISGTVSKIQNAPTSGVYSYNAQSVKAQIISIENKRLYIMTSGDYSIGDKITVAYLPESTVVLACYPDNNMENSILGFHTFFYYYRVYVPLSLCMLTALLLIISDTVSVDAKKTGKDFKARMNQEKTQMPIWRLHFGEIFLGIIIVCLLLGTDLQYGFFLINESEKQAVEIVGRVEKVESPKFFSLYQSHGTNAQTNFIVVNGKRLYIISSGIINVGDEIELLYLPKSKIVLQYNINRIYS